MQMKEEIVQYTIAAWGLYESTRIQWAALHEIGDWTDE